MASQSFYIKLVKQARGFLRGRFMKRFPRVLSLLKPLFKRDYWLPTPHRIAMGFAIGVFFAFAMLIVPLQMMCSAFACLFFKGNLPVALGTCWISNPFTIPPLIFAMIWVGEQAEKTGLDVPSWELSIPGIDAPIPGGYFAVGCVLSGIVLSLIAYPLMLGIMLALPKRIKKTKSKQA